MEIINKMTFWNDIFKVTYVVIFKITFTTSQEILMFFV